MDQQALSKDPLEGRPYIELGKKLFSMAFPDTKMTNEARAEGMAALTFAIATMIASWAQGDDAVLQSGREMADATMEAALRLAEVRRQRVMALMEGHQVH